MDEAALEPESLECDPVFTLGGGLFKRLSLVGGGGGSEDEDGAGLEMLPIDVESVAAELPALLLGSGGGEMTRPGPFMGRYGVPSASEEG